MKQGSPLVDTLIVKTVEYGVPKKSRVLHENPSSGIVRDWHLVYDVLKINCGTIVLGRDSCRRNYPNL